MVPKPDTIELETFTVEDTTISKYNNVKRQRNKSKFVIQENRQPKFTGMPKDEARMEHKVKRQRNFATVVNFQ